MAQTGFTPISNYYSATASNVPTAGNLVAGELAINTADGKLFYKDSSGVVQTMASKATGTVAGATTQVIYNNAGAYAGSANMTFDGTTLTANALKSATVGSPSSTALTLQSAGTTAVTISTAQNVGVGTTSPNAKLEVLSASGGTIRLSETASKYVEINGYGEGAANGSVMAFNTITAGTSTLTERGRFGNNGTLFIGATTSPAGTQRLVLTANGSAGVEPMLFNELRTGSATENYVLFYRNGSNVGSISNTSVATIYNTTSDYRLKENVASMTGALAKVQALKPVTYTWKLDGSSGQGFIAHELQAVVPECVSGEKDAVKTVDELDEDGNVIGTKEVPKYQGIDTSFLVATLTAAIQELKAQVDAQATTIAELQAKVA
jgi:hypothetical protein